MFRVTYGMHRLPDTWVLWAHLPHDSNWTIESYIQIMKISYVEEMLTLIHTYFLVNLNRNYAIHVIIKRFNLWGFLFQ